MPPEESQIPEITLTTDDMYRDDVYSDMRVGSVRRFTPVTPEGEDDDSRKVLYHGQTSLTSPAGPIPLNFELDATSLPEAMAAFPKAAQAEAERVIKEIEEMQRHQQAKQGQGSSSMVGGGESRIQMP